MIRWPLTRKWLAKTESGGEQLVRTADLASYDCCALIGSAGLGKTYELDLLRGIEEEQGADVRFERLAAFAASAGELSTRLENIAADLKANTVIFIDGIDEAVGPGRPT